MPTLDKDYLTIFIYIIKYLCVFLLIALSSCLISLDNKADRQNQFYICIILASDSHTNIVQISNQLLYTCSTVVIE